MQRTDEETPLLQGFSAEYGKHKFEPNDLPILREVLGDCPDRDTGAALEQYLAAHGIKRLGALRTTDPSIGQWFNAPGTIQTCASSTMSDWGDIWRRELDCPSLLPADEGGTAHTRLQGQGARTTSQLWTLVQSFIVGHKLCTAISREQSFPSRVPQHELAAYVVALRYPAAPQGVLQAMVRRLQAGGCSASVFTMPALQALVHYKWRAFARRLLIGQLLCYLAWLGSFMGFMLLFNHEDALKPNPQIVKTWHGLLSVVLEGLALLSMLPFLALDLVSMLTYGRGWVSTYNLLDVATYVLQVLITVLHLGQYSNGGELLPMAVAAQCILLWVRLQFFSRFFRNTKFDFVDSMKAVLRETSWYLAIMMVLMFAFACAFYTVFRDDDQASFNSLPLSMLTMLNYAIGGTSYYMRDLLDSQHPGAAIVLCIIYQFTVSMVVMSLLTGVMTNALLKVTQNEGVQLMASRAQMVDELEAAVPKPLRVLYEGRWNPRYVHVLRLTQRCAATVQPAADYSQLWEKAEHACSSSHKSLHADGARTGTSVYGGPDPSRPTPLSSHGCGPGPLQGNELPTASGSVGLQEKSGQLPGGSEWVRLSTPCVREQGSAAAAAAAAKEGWQGIGEQARVAAVVSEQQGGPDQQVQKLQEQVSRLEARLEQAIGLLQELAGPTLTPVGG